MTHAPPFMRLTDHDVERHLDYGLLFGAIEKAFVEAPVTMPRASLPYRGRSKDSTGTLLLMSAVLPDSLAVVKIITYSVERATGAIKYIYVVFEPLSGAVVAIVEGEALGAKRTAAVSIVAARYLAKPNPGVILVVGTGPVARELIKAYGIAYPHATLKLWGRRPAAVRAITEDFAKVSILVAAAMNLDDAVGHADIVSCATGSREPLIKGNLLRAGTHVDLIGGFTPVMREADDDVFRRAALVAVDNASALQESGDLCQPLAAGVLPKDRIASLESVFSGTASRRESELQLTVFKSVGNSVFDLAAARVLVDQMHRGEAHA